MKLTCMGCGKEINLKNGKGTCPRCRTAYDLKIHKPEKRTLRKQAARSHYTFGDQVYLFGWLLMIAAVAALGFGAANIWNNGLSEFKMGGFTLILFIGFVGFVMTGGLKKRRRA